MLPPLATDDPANRRLSNAILGSQAILVNSPSRIPPTDGTDIVSAGLRALRRPVPRGGDLVLHGEARLSREEVMPDERQLHDMRTGDLYLSSHPYVTSPAWRGAGGRRKR